MVTKSFVYFFNFFIKLIILPNSKSLILASFINTYKTVSRYPLQTTIVPSFDPFREQVQPLGHSCDKAILTKVINVPTKYTILSIMSS